VPVRFLLPSTLRPFANGSARLEFASARAPSARRSRCSARAIPACAIACSPSRARCARTSTCFVGDESIRYTGGLATPLETSEVSIVPR
jgi:hypothetical protein